MGLVSAKGPRGTASHLPRGGPEATHDLNVEVVQDVADDVSPVIASGHSHSSDHGQPERLQEGPGSVSG